MSYKSYNEDPKPTYAPQKKIDNKPSAAVPTAVPISHNGIRPVVPVLDMDLCEKLKIFSKYQEHLTKSFLFYFTITIEIFFLLFIIKTCIDDFHIHLIKI